MRADKKDRVGAGAGPGTAKDALATVGIGGVTDRGREEQRRAQ